MRIDKRRALAWRMRRQLLDPVPNVPLTTVVRRLCGVQAQVASFAELAVRVRRAHSRPGEVAAALARGRLIKTWAMRGALHLLVPEDAGAFLAALAAGRSWERPSWERYFGMGNKEWALLREAVREALDGRVLTRDELAAAVTRHRRLRDIGEHLLSGWGTLLKPSAYNGELCFGPTRDGKVTFMSPERASDRWAGLPDPDDAARKVIAAYLSAYGPATIANVRNWLSRGRIGSRQLKAWFGMLGRRVVEVDVEGTPAYVLAEHVDEIMSTRPTGALRLLPGFDQYVLGPGTEDALVIPPARRREVSREAGWIAPVAVLDGVVVGTWAVDRDRLDVAWFTEAGAIPRPALAAETERLSEILGRDLSVSASARR